MGALFCVLWRDYGMACNIPSWKEMLQIGLILGFKMSVNERIKGLSLDKIDSRSQFRASGFGESSDLQKFASATAWLVVSRLSIVSVKRKWKRARA